MPPNRHNTSIASSHRPGKQSKLESICQKHKAQNGSAFFSDAGAIFLLNFDLPHRESLAIILRGLRLKVFVPEDHGTSVHELKDREFRQADVILFDLTHLNHDGVWLPLRRICRLRKPDGMPLMVHCFSRIYRGSEFHLQVEKLGPRMDYYAE